MQTISVMLGITKYVEGFCLRIEPNDALMLCCSIDFDILWKYVDCGRLVTGLLGGANLFDGFSRTSVTDFLSDKS